MQHVCTGISLRRSGRSRTYGAQTALGRCKACNRAFMWKRGALRTLGRMRCPTCGGPLQQTTRNLASVAWFDLDA